MIAWLIFLSEKITVFLPFPELSLRFLGIAMHQMTTWFIVVIYQRIRGYSTIGWDDISVLCLILFHPLLGIFQILQTPDIPLLFFWSLSTLCFFDLLSKKTTLQFFKLGLCLGLGFSSKYMIVLWGLSFIILFLISFRRQDLRFLLRSRNIGAGLCGLFIASAPVWIWNYQNDWMSFKFQLSHGFEAKGFESHWVYDYLAGVFILGGTYFMCISRRAFLMLQHSQKLMMSFVLIQFFLPILFFLNSSFHAPTEVNWPIMGYMCLPIILVVIPRSKKWLYGAIGVSSAVTVVLCTMFSASWIKIPQIEQMKELKALGQRITADTHPLYTCQYQTAAVLNFYSRFPVLKLQDCSRYDFYDSKIEFANTHETFFLYKHDGQDIPVIYRPVTMQLISKESDGNAIYKVERRR